MFVVKIINEEHKVHTVSQDHATQYYAELVARAIVATLRALPYHRNERMNDDYATFIGEYGFVHIIIEQSL